MRLSVVIPTHDKAPLLERTLDSLAEQRLANDEWQVVVVDDFSSDGTLELLERKSVAWGERLRIVRPNRNLGRAAARNLGAREATGELLLFIDDDIIVPPGLLAAHISAVDGRHGWGTIGMVRTDPRIIDAPHFHYIDTRGAAKVRSATVPARYFVTQNASVPREDFLAVGGFDERFSTYGYEDMELAFRLEDRRGVTYAMVDEPVPIHVHHHSLQDWLNKKREGGSSSLLLLSRLHPVRILEMRLDWVLDVPGRPTRFPARLFRLLAVPPVGWILTLVARCWPSDSHWNPRLPDCHSRLLDLLVITYLRLGVHEADN